MNITEPSAALLAGLAIMGLAGIIEAVAVWRCIRRQRMIRAQVARSLAAIEQYTRDRSWG